MLSARPRRSLGSAAKTAGRRSRKSNLRDNHCFSDDTRNILFPVSCFLFPVFRVPLSILGNHAPATGAKTGRNGCWLIDKKDPVLPVTAFAQSQKRGRTIQTAVYLASSVPSQSARLTTQGGFTLCIQQFPHLTVASPLAHVTACIVVLLAIVQAKIVSLAFKFKQFTLALDAPTITG